MLFLKCQDHFMNMQYSRRLFSTILVVVAVFARYTKEESLGRDCKVMQEPIHTHNFDFNALHNEFMDYKITQENGNVFLINICGSLHKRCNGQDNVSVCLIDNGREIAIGRTNNSVLYNDGRLQLVLTGEKCRGDENSVVTILLMCNDIALTGSGPELLPMSDSNCMFYFIWYNRFSCTPRKEIECSTMDNDGRIYDLSRLTLHSSNYIAYIKETDHGPFTRIELNVCHSVIMGHGMTCQFNSGVCAATESRTDNYTVSGLGRNLGDVSKGPYFKDKVLRLKYETGDLCKVDGASDHHISTTIDFICDKSIRDSNPKLKVILPCQYHFIWRTFAACPIEVEVKTNQEEIIPAEVADNCLAINPTTKFELDLRSFMAKEYETNVTDAGTVLKLSICGPLINSSCGPGVASCLTNQNGSNPMSLGQPSSIIHNFKDETVPYLTYTGGAACTDDTAWSTLIMFECSSGTNIPEGPKFLSTFSCKYVVVWHTYLVCKRQIPCIADAIDRQIDLSELANARADYTTAVGNTNVIVNVCQPLRQTSNVSCPSQAAACLIDGSGTYLSLGNPVDSPTLNKNNDVILTYLNGSRCPAKPGRKLSSVFHFICDNSAGKGGPIFKGIISDCRYKFEWRTSYTCEDIDVEVNQSVIDCLVYDKESQMSLDLTLLDKSGGHKIVSGFSKRNYSVNLCGSNDTCDGSAVCEVLSDSWASYGQLSKVERKVSERTTSLVYTNGAPCDSTGNILSQAEIWLECDEGAGVGQPIVLMEDSSACYLLLEWKTAYACGNILSMVAGDEKTIIPSTHPQIGKRLVIIAIVLFFVALLALWQFRLLPRCPNPCACLLWRRERSHVSYSRQRLEDDENWGT